MSHMKMATRTIDAQQWVNINEENSRYSSVAAGSSENRNFQVEGRKITAKRNEESSTFTKDSWSGICCTQTGKTVPSKNEKQRCYCTTCAKLGGKFDSSSR